VNLSDLGTVFGMVVVAIGGASGAGKYYLDSEYIAKADPPPYNQVYVLVSAQNLQLLYAAQDELDALEDLEAPTPAQVARMATLRERIRHLKE